ncbi:hypothetical protein DRV84_05655 [Rhodosalinus sediminis]|uniref:Uncharacterized protein n=2 Tax=Rhodosalinus sediminis TaxID=1940533 RepID=A0A3D9BX22_9RHOB|nr:hypothetical protein DRV84_05655 [Rhodosalinus sediminis]
MPVRGDVIGSPARIVAAVTPGDAMQHDWIPEVLEDLRAYARENGLPRLAEELDSVRLFALAEIASRFEPPPDTGGHQTRGPR